MEIDGFRRGYEGAELDATDLDPDPVKQFGSWFGEAIEANLVEPNAMTLATADADGRVSARIVLLKGYSVDGFVFYTNYTGRKARDLAQNPRAALVFYWDRLERQVRVEGSVEKVDRAASETYFRSRPRGSQLSAWASPQSEVVASRQELLERARTAAERFEGREVPLPDHWGGYRLVPDAFELWQGRADRLHDRFRYSLRDSGGWRLERLAP